MRDSNRKLVTPAALLLAASLAAGVAKATNGPTADAPDAPRVTLFTRCDGEASETAFEWMREEVEEVLRPAGIAVDWRKLDLTRLIEPVASLVVVRFRGTCMMELPEPRSGMQGPLGRTHVSQGEVLPFCEVNCDRVREFIRSSRKHRDEEAWERFYGRALGKVLAHELYHVLANTRQHGEGGLAKPLLEPLELVGEGCLFEDEDLRRMRHGPRSKKGQEDPPDNHSTK